MNESTHFHPSTFQTAAAAIPRDWFDFQPTIGVILGSGWGQALLDAPCEASLPFSAIPGYGASTVQGHAGEVRILRVGEARVIAFCGRRHFYEGVGWGPVVMPVELMRRLGVRRLLLTNAAGAVNPALTPGDLLLIRDHINTTGRNPLQGPVIEGWGTRFPDQSEIYSKDFAAMIQRIAKNNGKPLPEGIYAYTAGPVYETPAEIRAYGIWGVDAVGMSTVPEATVANAIGMKTAALSCITNMAAGIAGQRLTHAEVIEATKAATPRMGALLMEILRASDEVAND